jgi:hypothetical protein
MGDEGALDGYNNIKPVADGSQVAGFVENVKGIFTLMEQIPEEAQGKVAALLAASYNTYPQQRAELIEYIEAFDGSQGMMGGSRKRAVKKSRKTRRRSRAKGRG